MLGCYHGINPAMGWLFAVALGLQERQRFGGASRSRPAHVRAPALRCHHRAGCRLRRRVEFPHAIVQRVAAGVLLGFGAYRLIRARHPRWVGMRVGFWGLTRLGISHVERARRRFDARAVRYRQACSDARRDGHAGGDARCAHAPYAFGWLVIAVHTLGYLAAMTAVAFVVYTKFGVSFLRTAWFNVDLVWGAALLATGIVAAAHLILRHADQAGSHVLRIGERCDEGSAGDARLRGAAQRDRKRIA